MNFCKSKNINIKKIKIKTKKNNFLGGSNNDPMVRTISGKSNPGGPNKIQDNRNSKKIKTKSNDNDNLLQQGIFLS